MSPRSPGLVAVLTALLSACGSGAPAASPSPRSASPSLTAPTTPAASPALRSAVPSIAAPTTSAATAGVSRSPSPSGTPTLTPRPTSPLVNADGSVWITPPVLFDFASPGDGSIVGILQEPAVGRDIVRIDPATNTIETVISGLPILPNPVSPVTANGYIWLASWDKSSVTQYDAATGEMIREIEVGEHPIEPVVAYGDVWTINHEGDSLTRIDVETGEAHPPIDLPGSIPLWVAPVADDLMLAGGPGQTIFLVDPERMQVTASYVPAECFGDRRAVIDGELWVRLCDTDEIAIVDPRTGEAIDSFESAALPYPPLVVDGNIWLPSAGSSSKSNPGSFQLVGLDPETYAVVGEYEQAADINEGSVFAEFDFWWRWGWEGLLRVPADTLREATTPMGTSQYAPAGD